MWDFTENDRQQVETIYQHFLPLLPNVDSKILYEKIISTYCYGENGIWPRTVEEWESILLKE